jgi:hypothetical protein
MNVVDDLLREGVGDQWSRLLRIHVVRATCDRAWSFFIPLFLTTVALDRGASGVHFSAALFAVRSSVEMLLAPIASALWDGSPTRAGLFLAAEHVCLVASALSLRALAPKGAEGSSMMRLAGAGIVMALEASLSKTLWNAVEKQQAFVESMRGERRGAQIRLANSNAMLARIDLVVAALVPFVVSAAAVRYGVAQTLVALVGVQLASAALVAPWLLLVFIASEGAHERARDTRSAKIGTAICTDELRELRERGAEGVRRSVLAAHALLHFTVVSPHGMLLAWLRERGIAESALTLFVAAAQLSGAAGSLLPALALHWSGGRLPHAAAAVQVVHAAAVVAAAIAACASAAGVGIFGVRALLLATALSRAALWGVDLLQRQLVQTTARSGKMRMHAFALQASWSQLASACMYFIALVPGVSFTLLCCVSAVAVLVSAALLALNALRPQLMCIRCCCRVI